MEPFVVTRQVRGVFVIAMNRPIRKNAMDTEMLQALIGAFDQEESAVVITGGPGAFSSGADVSEKIDADGTDRRMKLFCDLYELVTTFRKPVVAAIDGPCIGGGAEIAGACDLRVGTEGASIRFPGAQFGIPIGAARLVRLIGLSHAKDLLMTTRTMGGGEAYRMGYLNRLVSTQALEKEAIELALLMDGNPGVSKQKQMIDESAGLTAAIRAENRALMRWQRSARAN